MVSGSGLHESIGRVVANGNCSGCGACALLSPNVSMQLSESGFLRPQVTGTDDTDGALFNRICPGVRTFPAGEGDKRHPTFGRYLDIWQGYAVDPAIRFEGSSGGVLTAIAAWLAESGEGHEILGAAVSAAAPRRTVPVRIMSREEALNAAGSRYAPVGVAAAVTPTTSVTISKPCEAAALRAYHAETGVESPLLLSFFCAGTPSQRATDSLVTHLGMEPDDVSYLRYRGRGWPGDFLVEGSDGRSARTSYEESWGSHLGRDLQWRCKICADGTGESADVSVGDYWHTDERGYPVFDGADGVSVVFARTARGRKVLADCVAAGVIVLEPVDVEDVARIQPLQVNRRRTLLGRLLGRRLARKRIPRYVGYRLLRHIVRHPVANLRAALYTFQKSTR